MYISHTNEHLLLLLKEGDEHAFAELYDRYWKKLLVLAYTLLGSQEDSEEMVNDIFVSLWKKRQTIVIHHSFQTYISAMVKYGCLKLLADRKRQIRTIPGLPEAMDSSTQEWINFENLREELEAALNQLPDKCQLIFRYSREKGLSDKEIASKLDVSVNTVRTQIYRALRKLKTDLNTFCWF